MAGFDRYRPQSHSGEYMSPSGLGWIIVDALDTMMIMNLTTELTHARQWVKNNLTYDQDQDVNTFETTIRMLGGLLSAHYLSSAFPGKFAPVDDGLSDDMYVEKAADLADRLLSAYESRTGIPMASVNLHKYQGIVSHADGGASSTAEATTLQLEMKYLSKLTGEVNYWEKAEKVMKAIDDLEAPDGLVPIFVSTDTGTFRGNNIRLGSRGDSYYEYLIKQYLQTSKQEPVYQAMWNEALAGVKKNLITYSHPDNYTVLAERPNGLDNAISAKMDHLVCFMPGTIALATTGGTTLDQARKLSTWGAAQEEDMLLAIELMKTCMGMYAVTPTGLAAEITHFNLHDPPLMYHDFNSTSTSSRPSGSTDYAPHGENPNFQIHGGDVHNLLRPETIESLFYLHRITRDPLYRHWAWKIFQSFITHTATSSGDGFSSIASVLLIPSPLRDDMESFWLAETLKYFYLLFKEDEDLLPLDEVVFNTEAHPFPRFELGKLFKTGWKRKAERSERELEEEARERESKEPKVVTVVHTQMIQRIVEAMTATNTEVAARVEETAVVGPPVAQGGGV
jgi:mannosyl-oligosaccharide alpha-1,2-mannosidase